MKLEKKVHAVNEVQRLLKMNYDHIMPQLEKFVGKKIRLQTSRKAAQFKIDFLDEKPRGFEGEYATINNMDIYFTYTTIWLKIKIRFKDTGVSCFYESNSICIGEMDGFNLKSVRTEEYEPLFYDVSQVQADLKRKEEVEKALMDVSFKVRNFTHLY